MQKTNNQARNAHRQTQSSTTLSRKYVRRPMKNTDVAVSIKRSPKVVDVQKMQNSQVEKTTQNVPTQMAQNIAGTTSQSPKRTSPTINDYTSVRQENNSVKTQNRQLTAKELKDQAIKKALESSMLTPEDLKEPKKYKKKNKKNNKIHFGFGRMLLAISCATAAVMAIVYYANMNMPDMSLQVAALQTGVDASYPSYIPRDFSASGVTSEEGKITMDFTNFNTGDNFTLVEEASSWDSSALEANYVKEEFGENYTVVREQGLTIYISGSNAAWANGGVVFKLTTNSGELTNKQIKSIAVSAQ